MTTSWSRERTNKWGEEPGHGRVWGESNLFISNSYVLLSNTCIHKINATILRCYQGLPNVFLPTQSPKLTFWWRCQVMNKKFFSVPRCKNLVSKKCPLKNFPSDQRSKHEATKFITKQCLKHSHFLLWTIRKASKTNALKLFNASLVKRWVSKSEDWT